MHIGGCINRSTDDFAMNEFLFTPIAYVRSDRRFKSQLPRQPAFSRSTSLIEFLPHARFRESAADLRGFGRIWLIFCFHLNIDKGWKPKVRPPVSANGGKFGVFATRSPYRPNPIGLSCVELLEVEKTGLLIANSDLLDGTPILDVKPYIPEVDSYPDSPAGWRDEVSGAEEYQVVPSAAFAAQAQFILSIGGGDLTDFCRVQLSRNPTDSKCKRVRKIDGAGEYELSCRMWRMRFVAEPESRIVSLLGIKSGYSSVELMDGSDPYHDKSLHRRFVLERMS